MKHVLRPIEVPFAENVARLLQRYPQGKDGYILKLFRVFANSLRFATDKGVSNLLDRQSPLTLREREIVILRVTARKDCEYEWGVHVSTFSQAAELSDEQVAATRTDASTAPCWTEQEQVLIACVDQLCDSARIADASYIRFQSFWDLEQQLEILSLCGNYHLVCFVANTTRIDNEAFGATFPRSSTRAQD